MIYKHEDGWMKKRKTNHHHANSQQSTISQEKKKKDGNSDMMKAPPSFWASLPSQRRLRKRRVITSLNTTTEEAQQPSINTTIIQSFSSTSALQSSSPPLAFVSLPINHPNTNRKDQKQLTNNDEDNNGTESTIGLEEDGNEQERMEQYEDFNDRMDDVVIVPETVPPPTVPSIDYSTEEEEKENKKFASLLNKREHKTHIGEKSIPVLKINSIGNNKETNRNNIQENNDDDDNNDDDETTHFSDSSNSHRKSEVIAGLEPQRSSIHDGPVIENLPLPTATISHVGNLKKGCKKDENDLANDCLDKDDICLEKSLIQDLLPILRPYLRTNNMTNDNHTANHECQTKACQEQIHKYQEEIQLLKSKCLEWEQKYNQLLVSHKTQEQPSFNHPPPSPNTSNDNQNNYRIKNERIITNHPKDTCKRNHMFVPDDVPSSSTTNDIPSGSIQNSIMRIDKSVLSSSTTNISMQYLLSSSNTTKVTRENTIPKNIVHDQPPLQPDIVTSSSSMVRIKQEEGPNRNKEEVSSLSRDSTKDAVLARPKQESNNSSVAIDHPLEKVISSNVAMTTTRHNNKRKSRLSTRRRPKYQIASPLPPIATTNPTSSLEEKPSFKYCEVIRNKKERQTELKGYTCPDCQAFFDAAGMDAKEFHVSSCSKHRYRFTPPSTPDDFWELSFVDERNDAVPRQSWP